MAKNREPVKQPESNTSDESDSEESDSDSEPAPILVKKPPTSALDKSPPPPPQPSFSEEEEEEEEDDTDSNSEVPDLKTMPSKPPQKPEEEEEEEEEDDSGSDSDSKVPDPNVKPMASKSIETPQKPVKISQSKPLASVPAATSKSTSKRPAEEKELDEGKDSKKSKKKPVPESQNEPLGAASDSSKRVLFQRIWSEEDEIVVVKGMINYFAKKKSKPTADLGAFLEYIKKDLHIEVKKEQLKAKIQKLKKRYETNKIKGRNFTKPHEKELFDLSETYWGTDKGKDIAAKANGSVVKKMPIKKANIVENEEDDDTMMSEEIGNDDSKGKGLAPTRCSNGLTVDERVMRIGAELFEGANGVVEGYKEWKNLTIKEFELHVRRLDLMRTRSQLVLDYLKSKNH